MQKLRILIIEDDPVWAEGIAQLLGAQADMEVAAVLADWNPTVLDGTHPPFDAVLLDVGLGQCSLGGLEAAEEVCGLFPECQVIMLSAMEESAVIVDAFRAGAVNYITKMNYKDVPDAIRAACRNRSTIHACCTSAIRGELRRLKQIEEEELLSPAEKGVLRMVHKGYTQSQIGDALHIAERTIKNHVNRILKKLKVKNGKDAAEWAFRKGLLGEEQE